MGNNPAATKPKFLKGIPLFILILASLNSKSWGALGGEEYGLITQGSPSGGSPLLLKYTEEWHTPPLNRTVEYARTKNTLLISQFKIVRKLPQRTLLYSEGTLPFLSLRSLEGGLNLLNFPSRIPSVLGSLSPPLLLSGTEEGAGKFEVDRPISSSFSPSLLKVEKGAGVGGENEDSEDETHLWPAFANGEDPDLEEERRKFEQNSSQPTRTRLKRADSEQPSQDTLKTLWGSEGIGEVPSLPPGFNPTLPQNRSFPSEIPLPSVEHFVNPINYTKIGEHLTNVTISKCDVSEPWTGPSVWEALSRLAPNLSRLKIWDNDNLIRIISRGWVYHGPLSFPSLEILSLQGNKRLERMAIWAPKLVSFAVEGSLLLEEINLIAPKLEKVVITSHPLDENEFERWFKDSPHIKEAKLKECPNLRLQTVLERIPHFPVNLWRKFSVEWHLFWEKIARGEIENLQFPRSHLLEWRLISRGQLLEDSLSEKSQDPSLIQQIDAWDSDRVLRCLFLETLLPYGRFLQSLLLGGNSDPESLTYVVPFLSYSLETLHLWGNNLDDDGVFLLVNGLRERRNTTLKILGLGNNRIGPGGAVALAEILANDVPPLTDLDLSINCISHLPKIIKKRVRDEETGEEVEKDEIEMTVSREGLDSLSKALSWNRTLKVLNLSHNELGSDGVKALSGGLKTNTALTELNLENNKIGGTGREEVEEVKGIKALAKALGTRKGVEPSSSITNLNLRGNALGPKACDFLTEALKKGRLPLKTLNLSRNKMGGSMEVCTKGVMNLAYSLAHAQPPITLTSLNLGDNGITDIEALSFAKALLANKFLQFLYLQGNGVTKDPILSPSGESSITAVEAFIRVSLERRVYNESRRMSRENLFPLRSPTDPKLIELPDPLPLCQIYLWRNPVALPTFREGEPLPREGDISEELKQLYSIMYEGERSDDPTLREPPEGTYPPTTSHPTY